MKQIYFIVFLFTGCIIAFVKINVQNINAKNGRPNIILILFDDMGYSEIGCYGGEINTPNIDQLANVGISISPIIHCYDGISDKDDINMKAIVAKMSAMWDTTAYKSNVLPAPWTEKK